MLAKPLILVGISFLVVALIYGPSSTFHVFSSSQLDEVAPEAAPTPPPPPPPIGLPKIGGEAAPQIGEATEQPTAPGADEGTAARSIGGGAPPGGWCSGVDMNTCIPCDPGTSSSDPEAGGPAIACMPEECWNPAPGDECEAEECEGNICWPVPQIPQPPQIGERGPQVPLQQLETAPSRVVPQISEEIQETPPEPLPPCPEGQELDEESGLCVPVESPPTAEPPEAAQVPQAEEEEPPSEEPSSEDTSSN
jgi:hypothetical protein